MILTDYKLNRIGFTLIEVVLALGVFFISILALIGLLSPMLKSVDEIEKIDEITSVVNTVNTFLQSSSRIASRDEDTGELSETTFDTVYNAVVNDGHATLFVFRQYDDNDNIRLKVGFLDETNATVANSDVTDGTEVKAAGPIYRVVLTPGSVMPTIYYADTEEDSDGATVPVRNEDTGVYELDSTYTSDVDAYLEGYFAMEARIYAEDSGLNYDLATLPDGSDASNLSNLRDTEPDFTFNTAIVR